MRKAGAIAVLLAVSLCLSACSGLFGKATPDLQPHLIGEDEVEADPVRAVETREPQAVTGEGRVEQLDSLAKAVAEGYKPTFSQDLDPAVQRVYEQAIAVLNRYILNDFDEYARVHAIHDYLAYTVDYDAALYERYLNREDVSDDHPSFHLDGALLDRNAVCDGMSKAFAFLCNLEGIACVRILGSFDAQAHAWNKVRIDNRWYNVDVTMDKGRYVVKNETKFQLHHGFFLLSDASMTRPNFGRHAFGKGLNPSDEYAPDDYDYYGTAGIEIDGVEYAALITGRQQLTELFKAVGASKRAVGKVEVRLEIAGVNSDSTSAYASMIEAAYSEVKGDYVYSSDRGYLPYMRYPNGVFVFLIYK